MVRSRVTVVVAAVLCIGAIIWATVTLRSTRPDESAVIAAHGGPQPPPVQDTTPKPVRALEAIKGAARVPATDPNDMSRYNIGLGDHDPAEIHRIIRDAVMSSNDALSKELDHGGPTELLADTLGTYLAAHVSSSPEAILKWMETSGIRVPVEWRSNPDSLSRIAENLETMRTFRVDPTHVSVGLICVAGKQDVQPVNSNIVRRDAGRPQLEALPRAAIYEYEVVFPALLKNMGGVQFQGRIGFGFTWDPIGHAWVLTSSTVYDEPLGPTVRMPTL